MITTQLNHERVGLAAWAGWRHQLFDDVVAWARRTPAGPTAPTPMIEQPWVQIDLARCHAELEAMKLLNWRMAAVAASDDLTRAESSAIKVFGTETHVEVYRLPARHRRRGRLPPPRLARGRAARAARGDRRRRRSTPSAAGSTRSSARSSPPPGCKMARQAR